MPIDTKRLPVPETSQNPRCFVVEEPKAQPLVDVNGKRNDGRRPEELRPMFTKTGVISQARGSAYIELNNTKVICAVYGPREVTRREDFSMKGQLMCEVKLATFSCPQRRGHQMDTQERDYSVIVQEALESAVMMEKFPKAKMDVFVTVLENDGSCLAAAITVSSLALADAGVEMYDLVIATSLRQHGDTVLLDPSRTEEYSPQVCSDASPNGCVTVGFMPSINQVSALYQHGVLSVANAGQGVKLCIEACQRIYPVIQQCLVRSIEERLSKA